MSDEAASSESTATKKNDESFSFLLWLAKNGPDWARIPAIIAGLLVATVPGLLLISNSLNKWRESVAQNPAAKQLQMAAAGVISARDALVKVTLAKPDLTADDRQKLLHEVAEMNHELSHLNNPADEVKWTTFAKQTSKDYFGWKLFPSDKCLVIARIEDAAASAEWLRDPFHPTVGSLDIPSSIDPPEYVRSAAGTLAQSVRQRSVTFNLIPSVYASVHDNSELSVGARFKNVAQISPVQGECLNPHPWQWAETWGAYINQCQQPLFRRWADGCTHVQLYDHCYNVWGPVVWQFCAAYHHP